MKNKAVKPNVFVIDLLLLQVAFPLISAFIGWPFVSGATVRTLSNLVALVKMEPSPAPGMPHRVAGTVEQRVSGTIVGILVALSIFLGSVLGFIPIAALYGMFLYMGVSGLRDLQFVHRICSLMKRRKHWEDWEYVRGLPSTRILVFALIQSLAIVILIVLNIISEFTALTYAGVFFPMVVVLYGLIRELALPRWPFMAAYLHQLDRKYKLNPSHTQLTVSPTRPTSFGKKESALTFAPTADVYPYPTGDSCVVFPAGDKDELVEMSEDEEESEHEDGVIRETWAT